MKVFSESITYQILIFNARRILHDVSSRDDTKFQFFGARLDAPFIHGFLQNKYIRDAVVAFHAPKSFC